MLGLLNRLTSNAKGEKMTKMDSTKEGALLTIVDESMK